jgi:hypothetical protein
MIDQFRRGAALGAQRLPGRVRGIGFEAGEAAVFDGRDGAAPGDAQPAIGVNALHAGMIGHGFSPPVVNCVPDPMSDRPSRQLA